jgi:hypothetical protein
VRVRRTASLAVIAAALALAGCGSAGHRAPARKRTSAKTLAGPCAPLARAALASALRATPSAVTPHPFTPPSGVAACRFTAPQLNVVATLDSAPQAYQRFNRTTVEYAQNVLWAHLGAKAYPIDIPHLGLDADWIPPQRELITTDGVRLITVIAATVPAHGQSPEAVAARLARTYLGPLHNPYPV